MVSEETAKRIAEALERLTGMLERFEKVPTMPMPGGTGPGFAAPTAPHFASTAVCPVCKIDFGKGPMGYVCQNTQCPTGFRVFGT